MDSKMLTEECKKCQYHYSENIGTTKHMYRHICTAGKCVREKPAENTENQSV